MAETLAGVESLGCVMQFYFENSVFGGFGVAFSVTLGIVAQLHGSVCGTI